MAEGSSGPEAGGVREGATAPNRSEAEDMIAVESETTDFYPELIAQRRLRLRTRLAQAETERHLCDLWRLAAGREATVSHCDVA